MIREKFLKDISTTINNHKRFESYDFDITPYSQNKSGPTKLKITYKMSPKYQIEIVIPNTKTKVQGAYVESDEYVFKCDKCPGKVAYQESINCNGEEDLHKNLKIWLDCIWDELVSNPILKSIKSQEEKVEELFKKFDLIDDEPFNSQEVEELRKKLDDLESMLKTEIESSKKNKEELENEIDNLHSDIETLKVTINSFTRKGWIKSFTTKIFKWTSNSENRKMLKDGYTLIKEILPDNLVNVISN